LTTFDRVVSIGTSLDGAAVNAHKRQLAEVLIRHYLEDETSKRRRSICGTSFNRIRFGIDAFNRRYIKRRRQIIDNRVEKRLHALVLERRSSDNRHEFQADRSRAQSFADLRL